MATANVQVNANTQQAVGAFNALTQAVNLSQASIQNLNITVNNATTTNRNYQSSLEQGLGGAFEKLTGLAEGLFGMLEKVGAGIEFVFSTIVKEMDKLQGFNAMMEVSTKSTEQAAASYDFLRSTADKLGVQFDTLALNYTKLLAAIPDGNNKLDLTNKAFLGIAEAARTLHASNQDTQLMFYAITQMASKGVLSMEELRRQLAEKLPGSIQIAARAIGTDVPTMIAAISKGSVDSIKFLQYFSDELIRTFADSSEKASTSVSAAINRLTNVWLDFVKNILDSGAGKSIIAIFDTLREKLSDPILIASFTALVKDLADEFQSFIAGLTKEDIEKGFTEFAHFVRMVTEIIGDLIKGLTWLIDHAPQAGAAIGGVAGAAAGLQVAGPWGALAGGLTGAVGGAYAGRSLKGSPDDQGADLFAKLYAEQEAEQAAEHAKIDQLIFAQYQLLPMLDAIGKGKVNLNNPTQTPNPTGNIFDPSQINPMYANLFKAENLNSDALLKLNQILTDPKFKTTAQQIQALQDLSKTGQVLYPNANGLQDVTNGKSKLSAHDKSLNATQEKAYGLDADYPQQMANLNELYKAGRLNIDAYNLAVQNLVAKQPIEVAYSKQLKDAREAEDKSIVELFRDELRKSELTDKVNTQISDQVRLAGLYSKDLAVESELTKIVNDAKKDNVTFSEQQLKVWRDQIYARNQLNELSKVGEQIDDQMTDPYKKQHTEQNAMDLLLQKTKEGKGVFNEKDRTNYTVNSDPNMQGSQQWLDSQKKNLTDYYAFVNQLETKGVIDHNTAEQAKGNATATYNTLRLQSETDMFNNLATLSTSKNKELAAIGRGAAVASATISGYLAIQKALAADPGWPYNAGNVIAVTIAQATNVAKIAGVGFEEGGYTGNGGTSDIAGIVHGQEFVSHATATAKNRAALEAANRGATLSIGGSSGGQNVSVIINNNSSNTQVSKKETDTPTGKQIEVMISDTVSKQIRTGGKIASALEGQYNLNRSAGLAR